MFSFKFKGIHGKCDGALVRWGNASFQIEAAGGLLRAAIESARPTTKRSF